MPPRSWHLTHLLGEFTAGHQYQPWNQQLVKAVRQGLKLTCTKKVNSDSWPESICHLLTDLLGKTHLEACNYNSLHELLHQFTIFHPQIGRFPLDLVSWPHQAPPLSCYSPGQILISLNDIIPEALLSRLAGPAGRSRPVIHRVGLSKITENRLSKRERFQNKRKTIIPQFTFSRLKIHVHTDEHNTLSLEMLGSSRQRPIGLRTFRVNLLQHSRPSISQCLLGCLGDNGEWHMNKHITSKFGSKPPDEKSS